MIIKFTNFSDGIHHLEFQETAEKLNLGSDFVDDVLLNCEMDKSPGQIILSCNISATTQLTCDRCNKEYNHELQHNFKMTYLIEKERITEDGTDIHYLSPDTDKVDLHQDVSELTTLALPMKHLCDENCKGLCPICGINLNENSCDCKSEEINPVWEPLLKLKDKLKN